MGFAVGKNMLGGASGFVASGAGQAPKVDRDVPNYEWKIESLSGADGELKVSWPAAIGPQLNGSGGIYKTGITPNGKPVLLDGVAQFMHSDPTNVYPAKHIFIVAAYRDAIPPVSGKNLGEVTGGYHFYIHNTGILEWWHGAIPLVHYRDGVLTNAVYPNGQFALYECIDNNASPPNSIFRLVSSGGGGYGPFDVAYIPAFTQPCRPGLNCPRPGTLFEQLTDFLKTMDLQTQIDPMSAVPLDMPDEGYALVTIAAGNITEYHGKGVPAYARLYANQQFTAADGVVVGQGSIRKPDFCQEFAAEQNGPHIFIFDGDAYATTNSNVPGATYTLAVYDAKGRVLITPYTRLRIPHAASQTTWQALEGFSRGVHLEYPPTYLDSIALYQIIAGLEKAQIAPGAKQEIQVHNDNDWRVVEPQLARVKAVYKHLKTFASLASAAGDAAVDPTRPWIVTVDETPTSNNLTFPDNFFLDYSKGFGLNTNAGQIVNITPPVNAPPHQIFTGAGQARIKKHYAFKNADAVWYVPPGSQARATITWAASEALRYAIYNNDGGDILFPIGEYGIDHYCLLQIGGVRGAGNNPHGKGTVIVRTGGLYDGGYYDVAKGGEGQASIFRFRDGGRNMHVTDMVLKSESSNTAAMLSRDDSTRPGIGNIDGIFIDNVTVRGCAEAYKVTDTHSNKNWQVHNAVMTRRSMFLGQTVACVSIDSINAGGEFVTANCEPAPNGVAVGFKGHTFAKTLLDFNGIGVQGHAFEPDLPESVTFTFAPADIDIGGNKLNHATADGLENADRVYLATTNTLPAPLKPATSYWWNKTGKTFHNSPADALSGANAVDLADQGLGTHTLHSSRPNPVLTAQQPLCMIQILGAFSEGLTVTGLMRDEGSPWMMRVEDTTPNNTSGSIDFFNCVSLGQFYFGANVRVNLHGGQYRTQSFKDRVGVAAKIHSYGANLYTYGVGTGQESMYGGYIPPSPRSFADFIGGSYFDIDTTYRLPSPADTSTPGRAVFDISRNDEFTLTPTSNLLLDFIGGKPGQTKVIRINVLTAGVVSFNLTKGLNAIMQSGPFATGDLSGGHFVLEFYWNGSWAIETGRKFGSYANPKLTGAVEISGPDGALKIKGRDGNSFIHFYSDPSGKVRIFADVGGRDLLAMDTNEAIFASGMHLKLQTAAGKKGLTIKLDPVPDTDAFEVTNAAGQQRFLLDKNGTIGTKVNAAPADADIDNGELFYWFDTANSKVKFKAKLLDGTVKTGEVALA